MATKPVTTFTHATDANFASGPATGQPTKIPLVNPAQGYIPGDAVAAEFVNYEMNVIGQWITDWLAQGSSSAGLDAHIVETDANGISNIASMFIGGTASASQPLRLLNNVGFGAYSAYFTNNDTGSVLFCDQQNAAAAVPAFRARAFGSGASVEGDSTVGTGIGVLGTGGGISPGGFFTGGAGGGGGVSGLGVGTGPGGFFQGGVNGHGAVCVSGTVGGPAVGAFYTGAGAPARGRVYIQPTDQPATNVDGDLWKRAGGAGLGRGGVEVYDDDGAPGGGAGGKMRLWATPNGVGHLFAQQGPAPINIGGVTTPATAVLLTSIQLGLSLSPGEPDGTYRVDWSVQVHRAGGTAGSRPAILVRVNGTDVETHTRRLQLNGVNGRETISGFVVVSHAGVTTIELLGYRIAGPATTIEAINAKLFAVGTFD